MTELDDVTHAYVGRKPCCRGVCYVGVDDSSPSLAKEIAQLIRDGRTIERMTIEDSRKIAWTRCTCEPSAAEKKVIARHIRARAKLEGKLSRKRAR